MIATVVDTTALWETVVASFVAGIGVTLIYSIAIFGAARFAEAGRDGRNAQAVVYGALTVLAALAFVAVIVVGLIVMTAK